MTTPRLPAGLRWLLVGSLALNVALLAGIGWLHFDHRPMHHGPARHVMHGVMMPSPRMLREAVPEPRRAVVDQVLHRHHRPIRESVRGVFQARTRVHRLLSAEHVDPAALDRAFATLRERDAQAAQAVQAMLADLARHLTPEERRVLAERMQHRPRRPHRIRRNAPPSPRGG